MAIKEEKQIEKNIIDTVTELGGFIKKIEPKANTGNKGYPDLTGVLNGRYLAIEVKKIKGGKPTPVQLRTLQEIANAGGIAIVTNDVNIVHIINNMSFKTKKIPNSDTASPVQYENNIQKNITPEQAIKLWRQKPDIHTLQILPESK